MERESPASAGLSRVRTAAAVLVLAVLGGCAVGDGGGDDELGALPEHFAQEAQPLVVGAEADGGVDRTTTTTSAAAGSGRPTTTTAVPGGANTSSPSPDEPRSGSPGTTSTTVRPFREVVALTDRTRDAGIQARPYGDLVRLALEDDGTRARVTVEVAGDLPARPAEGEVMGFGVDFYRSSEESDYQLFALGNADGWRAWLQEGDGDYVAYPGTFELGGNRLVFTVPWASLGGRRAGSLSVFADWAQGRVAVVADASADRAPDRGTQPFSP